MVAIKKAFAYVGLALFVALGVVFGVARVVEGEFMRGLLGFASAVFILIIPLFRRLMPTPPWVLMGQVFLFCILAYDFGCVLQMFDTVPFLDKISHFLSGILFTELGFLLYGLLRQKQPAADGTLLPASYAVFFSTFVAVIWECVEFVGFLTIGLDSQHHLDTGVFDTMGDLIACLFGSALTAVAWAVAQKWGAKGIDAAVVRDFSAGMELEE